MEPEGSSQYAQKSTTGHNPESVEYSLKN